MYVTNPIFFFPHFQPQPLQRVCLEYGHYCLVYWEWHVPSVSITERKYCTIIHRAGCCLGEWIWMTTLKEKDICKSRFYFRMTVCKFVINGICGADQTNGGPISVSSMSYHGHMKINCRADQLKLSSNRLGWSSHWLPWVFACGCSWQDSLYPHFLCSSFRITGACFRSPYSSREAVTDVTASLIGWG